MGRIVFAGRGATAFLQRVLTNNAAELALGQAQYTVIPNARGGAIDDAFLYRFEEGRYLLVVNASNRLADLAHFRANLSGQVEMLDQTDELAMISLQGPASQEMLSAILDQPALPAPARNSLGIGKVHGAKVLIARTGYTGEPVCFELMIARQQAGMLWDLLAARGAAPVGLGARDTLRLEAALPLYGHELGIDRDGKEIPILAIAPARFAVSFAPAKGEFIGREALLRQHAALERIGKGDYSDLSALPRRVMPLAVLERLPARAGCEILGAGERALGYVTSGTVAPYWRFEGQGPSARPGEQSALRPVALGLVDSSLKAGDKLQVQVRQQLCPAVVGANLNAKSPPYARPVLY
jgi:aminomethyltransferase